MKRLWEGREAANWRANMKGQDTRGWFSDSPYPGEISFWPLSTSVKLAISCKGIRATGDSENKDGH